MSTSPRADSAPAAQAPFADLAYVAMEQPSGPLDFAVLLELRPSEAPQLDALRTGAAQACAAYPKSSCRLVGTKWVRAGEVRPSLDRVVVENVDAAIAEYIAVPIALASGPALLQRLFVSAAGERQVLVTRMHHALGDLQSAISWLEAQLTGRVREDELLIESHPRAVRRSAFAFESPAERLWRSPQSVPSGRRRFRCEVLECLPLRVDSGGFTWNDLLAAVALETFAQWNVSHGGSDQVGCWIPVNIRTKRGEGFGNGASRIRVYRRSPWPEDFREAAQRVRAQVRWSKDQGEWNVPAYADRLAALPPFIAHPIVRAYARRPGVDWATGLFSHAERLGPDGREVFPSFVERIGVISHLYAEHPMALAAVGHRGHTQLTFTWDDALFPPAEAERFLSLHASLRAKALAEVRGHA